MSSQEENAHGGRTDPLQHVPSMDTGCFLDELLDSLEKSTDTPRKSACKKSGTTSSSRMSDEVFPELRGLSGITSVNMEDSIGASPKESTGKASTSIAYPPMSDEVFPELGSHTCVGDACIAAEAARSPRLSETASVLAAQARDLAADAKKEDEMAVGASTREKQLIQQASEDSKRLMEENKWEFIRSGLRHNYDLKEQWPLSGRSEPLTQQLPLSSRSETLLSRLNGAYDWDSLHPLQRAIRIRTLQLKEKSAVFTHSHEFKQGFYDTCGRKRRRMRIYGEEIVYIDEYLHNLAKKIGEKLLHFVKGPPRDESGGIEGLNVGRSVIVKAGMVERQSNARGPKMQLAQLSVDGTFTLHKNDDPSSAILLTVNVKDFDLEEDMNCKLTINLIPAKSRGAIRSIILAKRKLSFMLKDTVSRATWMLALAQRKRVASDEAQRREDMQTLLASIDAKRQKASAFDKAMKGLASDTSFSKEPLNVNRVS
jgi:hypothetical protein